MAGRRRSMSSPISFGNCKFEIEGGSVACESSGKDIVLSISDHARIRISEDESKKETFRRCLSWRKPRHALQDHEGTRKLPWVDHTFVLLNPKDVDSRSKSLLQEALKIYTKELPTMNFAANTGKASQFLERCLSSGKYTTLILSSNSLEGSRKVIAAVTFQIIPVDTQFAEIPLTAVTSSFQRKEPNTVNSTNPETLNTAQAEGSRHMRSHGIGCMMYEELKERFISIGISTVFCWADKESENFWLKQGFTIVGEVDGKGRARKLPVRADIRRTLCFPGDATLMVAHLRKDIVAFVESSQHADSKASVKATANEYYGVNVAQLQLSKKDFSLIDIGNTKDVADIHCHADERFFSSGQRGKRLVWEASLSSLKSKRVRGSHVPNDSVSSDQNCSPIHDERKYACFNEHTMDAPGCPLLKEFSNSIAQDSKLKAHFEEEISTQQSTDRGIKGCFPRIMFMNIADDEKKSRLTKIVEELGGSVTSSGSYSTHVITGKARRTLNFCLSLCSGTWIVSTSWLKSSFLEGMFLDESQHILEDEDYQLRYKCRLRDAVARAKSNPHSLFRGYQVSLSKHIHPSVNELSLIIFSAGGIVTHGLRSVVEPAKTIFIACEEDMEEALLAAKMGVRTFTSDWLMNCVMTQELDLDAHQFAESL